MDKKPAGTPCVSVRLNSNNIDAIDARAFKKLPHLRCLDCSTNHLARFDLPAKTVSRLSTLALRNNRISDTSPLGMLVSLRQLDVSFNSIGALEGIERLTELRVLLANGNELSGHLPRQIKALRKLNVLDLSQNQLSGASVDAVNGLISLSTLRCTHNRLPARMLPDLAFALSQLPLIRRLELYANPMAKDHSYPDALLKAQPAIVQVDHMRQPAGELAAGVGAVSRRSVTEAIDAIANAALAQHAVLAERHRAAHSTLLDALRSQEETAMLALEEYRSVTSKAEDLFREAIADAKRVGKTEATVDKVLDRRKELLESEKKSQERYRAKIVASVQEVNRTMLKIAEGTL